MNHLQHHAQKQCQSYGDFIMLFLLLKSLLLLLYIKRIEIIKHILLFNVILFSKDSNI